MPETKNLDKLFSPHRIAVVGASRDVHKVGHIVLRNILESGFKGLVWPVNPEAGEILGRPAFARYADVPSVPDLAVLAVPAAIVLQLLPEIAERGTKDILILSAGFKEEGVEGQNREVELLRLAEKFSLRIVGPNCLGFINNRLALNVTFAEQMKKLGNLRFITQSGAIASSIFDWAETTGLGFSDFVTLGNKSVLDEVDILRYWLEGVAEKSWPSRTEIRKKGGSSYRPIGLYLESIARGTEFVKLLKTIGKTDPVFILKPGQSAAARAASVSHTGALANDDAVLSEALREAGAVRCEGIEDFFDLARAFAWEEAPRGAGVAIVSNAGGPAVVTTDAIALSGLTLAKLSEHTEAILAQHLPPAANIKNPVDVLGDALADRYRTALVAVLQEPTVDAVIAILTPQVMTQIKETAAVIGELSLKFHKPILASFIGAGTIEKGEQVLNEYRIPSFRFPERAVKALAKMYAWAQWQEEQKKVPRPAPIKKITLAKSTQEILASAAREGRRALSNAEAQFVVADAGVTIPFTKIVRSGREAVSAASILGYPVALKISSSALVHKTEAGGVVLNLHSDEQLRQAFLKLAHKVLVIGARHGATADIELQKQITGGVEVIVGFKRDPSFGDVCLFGAGGTLAEILNDTNLALLPLNLAKAEKLVQRAKIFPLLSGFRGAAPLAIEPLFQCIVKLSILFESVPEISELEVNPVLVTTHSAWAADARVILK